MASFKVQCDEVRILDKCERARVWNGPSFKGVNSKTLGMHQNSISEAAPTITIAPHRTCLSLPLQTIEICVFNIHAIPTWKWLYNAHILSPGIASCWQGFWIDKVPMATHLISCSMSSKVHVKTKRKFQKHLTRTQKQANRQFQTYQVFLTCRLLDSPPLHNPSDRQSGWTGILSSLQSGQMANISKTEKNIAYIPRDMHFGSQILWVHSQLNLNSACWYCPLSLAIEIERSADCHTYIMLKDPARY